MNPLVKMPVAVPGMSENRFLTIRVRPGFAIPIPAPRTAVQIVNARNPDVAARSAVPARISVRPMVIVFFIPSESASIPPGSPNTAIRRVGTAKRRPVCA